jgi:OPA family sugar phosphate sensor protein UhpC-like MFS transporter|tara:strand:- start:523 stop:1875 length:1353 start_codon:yes stop_codon:yes gene_type:complete
MPNLIRFFATGKDKPTFDDKEKIDKLYKQSRLSVILVITIGYGFAYPLRLVLSVIKKPLIDGGIFTADELGMIGSAFFYVYAFGKLTNGFLADHANIKRFFATGVLVSALINLLMGWSTLLWVWVILWGLNGWFQGFGAPTGAVALSNWFSNQERGRYYGIWSTAHSVGEGLTFLAVAPLVSYLGWQAGFWGPGIFCIFVAVGIYFFLQDRPQTLGLPSVADWKNDYPNVIVNSKGEAEKTGKLQLSIFKLPSIWVLGLASATMYMTRYAINSWGILYLQEVKNYSLIEAGGLIGVSTFAAILGSVAYGYISDKLFNARRPPVTLIFGLLEVLALFIIFFSPSGQPAMLTIGFILYGFTLSGILAALGGLFAIDIAPKKAAGAAMGFIGVFSYIGAAVQDQISGLLIEHGTTVIDGIRHYDFSNVIVLWIGSSIVSLILASSLWRVKVGN